jgi:hypothetical protein
VALLEETEVDSSVPSEEEPELPQEDKMVSIKPRLRIEFFMIVFLDYYGKKGFNEC